MRRKRMATRFLRSRYPRSRGLRENRKIHLPKPYEMAQRRIVRKWTIILCSALWFKLNNLKKPAAWQVFSLVFSHTADKRGRQYGKICKTLYRTSLLLFLKTSLSQFSPKRNTHGNHYLKKRKHNCEIVYFIKSFVHIIPRWYYAEKGGKYTPMMCKCKSQITTSISSAHKLPERRQCEWVGGAHRRRSAFSLP